MTPAPIRPLAALLTFLALILLPHAAHAQFGSSAVTTRMVPERTSVRPGDQVAFAVVLDHAESFHTWPAAVVALPADIDEFAIRTEIALPEPPQWVAKFDGIQWPEAKPDRVANPMGGDPIQVPLYSHRAVAFIRVLVSPEAQPGPATLSVTLSYQACDESTCQMPQEETLSATVTIAAPDAAAGTPNEPDLFATYDASQWGKGQPAAPATPARTAAPAADAAAPSLFGIEANGVILLLLLAIIGGAVLNLTPCVLPIIPIKVMTLVQHAGGSRGRALVLGLWMALGVVTFWLAAGLPMAIFSSAADPSRLIFGTWWVTLSLGVIIAAMGLGIMGLFTLNLPQSVYMINPKADTPWGSFVFGIMTAVLGLPCFGFVAGGLLAGTAALGALKIMVIFLGLGVGMALPYLVLAAYPALVNKIPRTGPASELVKQVMGLLLIAAAAFFAAAGIKALLVEKPHLKDSIAWWAVAFFVILAAAWLTVRTLQIARKAWPKVVMPTLGVLASIGCIVFADGMASADTKWREYEPAAFQQALNSGKIVVADFTADWCINCKALKRTILDADPVRSRLRKDDIILFKVDLTTKSAPGWKLLGELGRSNVPTLAIFGPGVPDPIIYNAYTPDTVLSAVQQAAGGPGSASAPPTALGPAPGTAPSGPAR